MKGFQLIATGGALPGRTVTNEELSRTVDTSDAWITSRTGIRTRHWCTADESAATLAIAAAKQALAAQRPCPCADIACCVCATLSAPDATPSVACQVQAALGLPEDRPALDVNAACSGFLYGTSCGAGPAGHAGRAVRPGHRVRSPFPPDGPRRPLHLRPVWRRSRCGHLPAGRHSLCPHAGRPGQRRPACRRAGPEQVLRPSPWTARQCSALRWMPCPSCLHTVLDETRLDAGRGRLGGLPSGQQPHHRPLCAGSARRPGQSSTRTWTATATPAPPASR